MSLGTWSRAIGFKATSGGIETSFPLGARSVRRYSWHRVMSRGMRYSSRAICSKGTYSTPIDGILAGYASNRQASLVASGQARLFVFSPSPSMGEGRGEGDGGVLCDPLTRL